MSARFGGATEVCPVCDEKVYAMDRFVIEKMVIHKGCFKCKHCGGKLGLGNFAAVNQQVYCKTHYLQLFRESGGRYDKAFGGGGFERTSTEVGYTPGQFKGIGAPTTTGGAGPKVKEVMKKFQDTASPTHAAPKPKEVISPVKPPAVVAEPEDEQNTSFESVSSRKSAYLAAVGNDQPTAAGQGNFKRTASTDSKKNAYLAAMAQTNNGGSKQVDTNTSGLSISERIKLYSSSASSSSSLKDTSAVAAPQGISKLSDRLQQYQNAVTSSKGVEEEDNEEPQQDNYVEEEQQQQEEPEQDDYVEEEQQEEREQYEDEEQQQEGEYEQEEAQEEVPVA